MMAAMFLLQAADSGSDIGSLVDQLMADLQGKLWLAAIPVGVLLVLAVLRKFGVIGAKAPAAPAPIDPKPAADAAKAQDLLDGKK